jgi:toxin FitB
VSYLLDTNVISELTRKEPSPAVLAWFAGVTEESLHLSVLTVGELRRGVELLPAGRKRERLRRWVENQLPGRFGDRMLDVSRLVADRWGRIEAAAVRSIPSIDGLLAATAVHHDLRLVTRNVRDFQVPGLVVINPWE